MKTKNIITCAVVAIMIAGSALMFGADSSKQEKVIPYTLDKCIVSGEKLGGSMGKPYVITYKGREIKFCCKGCESVFMKNPEKYINMIVEAEKKAKK